MVVVEVARPGWRELVAVEVVVVVVVEVLLEEGLVQTEESEADRERDSSLREVRWEVTEDLGEAPPLWWWCGDMTLLWCRAREALGVEGPPDAAPPPPCPSLSTSSNMVW